MDLDCGRVRFRRRAEKLFPVLLRFKFAARGAGILSNLPVAYFHFFGTFFSLGDFEGNSAEQPAFRRFHFDAPLAGRHI
jgi:hypothetical protein